MFLSCLIRTVPCAAGTTVEVRNWFFTAHALNETEMTMLANRRRTVDLVLFVFIRFFLWSFFCCGCVCNYNAAKVCCFSYQRIPTHFILQRSVVYKPVLLHYGLNYLHKSLIFATSENYLFLNISADIFSEKHADI